MSCQIATVYFFYMAYVLFQFIGGIQRRQALSLTQQYTVTMVYFMMPYINSIVCFMFYVCLCTYMIPVFCHVRRDEICVNLYVSRHVAKVQLNQIPQHGFILRCTVGPTYVQFHHNYSLVGSLYRDVFFLSKITRDIMIKLLIHRFNF